MRVTIQKTIELEEVPEEINEDYSLASMRLLGINQLLERATVDASMGKYVDSSSAIEKARQSMAILDKNLEEVQSLCLSYEKVRIQQQMPEPQTTGTMNDHE
jgi:hypothetical protein